MTDFNWPDPHTTTPSCSPHAPPVLGLMTKYWQAGQVKTRLGADIGMRRAAALHRQFVRHLLQSLGEIDLQRVLCYAPDHQREAFADELRTLAGGTWQLQPQGTGDLGQRMQRWFQRVLHQDAAPAAVLIGGDCPTLDPAQITTALRELATHDLVIGPAVDGGYYLIGIRGPWREGSEGHRALFQQIRWSSDQVMAQTRQRAAAAGLSLAELTVLEDVDTAAELDRLQQSLADCTGDLARLSNRIAAILADSSLATPHPSDRHSP